MKNFVQPGRNLTVTAPAAVKSGDLVVVGKLFGVAATDAESDAAVEICTEGVFTLPKVAEQAWAQGAAIYWAGGETNAATTTASSNTLIGHAAEAAANPSTTGVVRLSI